MEQARRERRRGRVVQVWVRPLLTALVWVLAVALLFYFFAAFKVLFLGVLAAAAMAALLRPLADWIPGPRGLGAAITGIGALLIAVGLIFAAGWFVARPIQQEWQQWPQTRESLNAQLAAWSARFDIEKPPTVEQMAGGAARWAAGSGSEILSGTAGALVNVLVALAFVFIGSMYILAERPGRLTEPAIRLFPRRRWPQLRAALEDLQPRLRWWIIGTSVSMAIVGITSAIGYKLVGLKFGLPLGLLSGLAEIVPTVGPILALVVGLVFAGMQGTQQIVGVFIVYAVVQTLESYVIQPLVMKRAVKMPPIVTLFTVVLWGKIFGASGLLLAIPINLVIWSFVDRLMLRRRMKREESRSSAPAPAPPQVPTTPAVIDAT